MATMLHWLAGAKPPEGHSDPDATGLLEPPETPAPVFAVRAFKQAIFGTPQTVPPKPPRRHSNTENPRPPRLHGARPERPTMTRPKSASDARAIGKDDEPLIPEPLASPTKGILMTPGTAAARRKTVTFGDSVMDNEEKRPVKSGLPDDCPGKFPSPWQKPEAAEDQAEEPIEKGRGRSKLTEALEQAREESTKRKSKLDKRSRITEDEVTKDYAEPKSESGRYWKTQYDVYRENSQREIRKLITKQKAAKSFAREKDFQCTELADQLRQEKKRAEKLEKRALELEAQLKAMQRSISDAQEPQTVLAQALNPRSAVVTERSERDLAVDGQSVTNVRQQRPPTSSERSPEQTQGKTASSTRRPLTSRAPLSTVDEQGMSKPQAKPDRAGTGTNDDDIWAQSFGSSSPVLSRSADRPSSKDGRAVTCGTGATPLMSLNINTLSTGQLARRDSAQPSPPMDRFAKEPLIRQEVVRSPKTDEVRGGSPVLSRGLPQLTSETTQPKQAGSPQSPGRRNQATVETELSSVAPASSPFQPNVMLSPPAESSKSYFDQKKPIITTTRELPPAKENVSPNATIKPVLAEKPSATWNSINAPGAGKRVTSMADRSGKEVSMDRLEAARARQAAKGRVVS